MADFSVICAIEAGRLECQTLLLLKTLRRFGGAFASVPAVAFQGRAGPRPDPRTLRALDELEVEYVRRPGLNKAPWFNYTNKIAAVAHADASFRTDWSVWLDSDILVLAEPAFATDPRLAGNDFLARFDVTGLAVGADGGGHTAFWERACGICGTDFARMPVMELDFPATRMKPYFNSGVMLWRTGSSFAADYARNYYRILGARIAPRGVGPWFADQISLTPTVAGGDLRWAMLSASDNFMMFQGFLDNPDFAAGLGAAAIVHYSKSRDPALRERFDGLVARAAPGAIEIARELDGYDPQPGRDLLGSARRHVGRLRQKLFAATCTEI